MLCTVQAYQKYILHFEQFKLLPKIYIHLFYSDRNIFFCHADYETIWFEDCKTRKAVTFFLGNHFKQIHLKHSTLSISYPMPTYFFAILSLLLYWCRFTGRLHTAKKRFTTSTTSVDGSRASAYWTESCVSPFNRHFLCSTRFMLFTRILAYYYRRQIYVRAVNVTR